jgi:hypothetical protein
VPSWVTLGQQLSLSELLWVPRGQIHLTGRWTK